MSCNPTNASVTDASGSSAGQGRKLRFNLRRQLAAAAFDPRQLLSRCKFVCNVAEQSVARRKSRAVGKQCARADPDHWH